MYLLLNARLFTNIPANFLQTKALTEVERRPLKDLLCNIHKIK